MSFLIKFIFILTSFLYPQKKADESTAFLSIDNVILEKMNDTVEKKKFVETIYMEKQKIQDYVLRRILDNAYDLYSKGDYSGAAEVAKKVLSIDPTFEEARVIANVSGNVERPGRISYEDEFQNALSLYQKGEVLEAYRKMQVLSKLSPGNAKAKYWYKKMEGELKNYYIAKAEEAYNSNDKRTALSYYYKALEYAPKDEGIVSRISVVEGEIRKEKVNLKLREALEIYAKGKLEESYNVLKEAISINPGDEKLNKIFVELKNEIEQKYVNEGKALYIKKKYNDAIKSFSRAMIYSENPKKIEKMINDVRDRIKKEEEIRRRKEEERRRKEEERRKKEEEEKKNKEQVSGEGEEKNIDKNKIIAEQNKKASQEHYLEGVKFLQMGDYQKAKEKFATALKLDPSNTDAEAALKRVEQILSGGGGN